MPGVDNSMHVYISYKALGSLGEILSQIMALLIFLLHESVANWLLLPNAAVHLRRTERP
jgi:hypothetical protein